MCPPAGANESRELKYLHFNGVSRHEENSYRLFRSFIVYRCPLTGRKGWLGISPPTMEFFLQSSFLLVLSSYSFLSPLGSCELCT